VKKLINVYDKFETVFTHNGLVVLSDNISCKIIEELNGPFVLDLEHPLDKMGKWQNLLEGNIIKADGQLFRIYHKIKNLNSIRINARHIFYDLVDNFLEDVRPTNLSGYGALDWILTHTQYSHSFNSMGDVGGSNTRYFVRKNVVEAIMGQEGIINTWGGELVRDNFTIKLLEAIGLDRGVLVAYGKNIQGIEETLDIDGICTRLMPIGKDGLLLPEKYIDSQYINNFPHPKIKVVEFTDIETVGELRTAAQKYMLDNKIDIPQFNYKIDFLELSKTEEYKNYAVLERVYLGDTVTIRHSKLNINLKAKVIKITKNVLTNRIEKIELGSFKPNLATGINNSIQNVKTDIENAKNSLQLAIDNATNLLTTALGGYVLKRDGELLIMDTEDPMTATKVWRWNINGLGYSDSGINGPYGLAMTMDGAIVADFITTGTLSAGLIKTGLLKSFNNLTWLNMDSGTFNFANKLIFDGLALKFINGEINGAVIKGNSIEVQTGIDLKPMNLAFSSASASLKFFTALNEYIELYSYKNGSLNYLKCDKEFRAKSLVIGDFLGDGNAQVNGSLSAYGGLSTTYGVSCNTLDVTNPPWPTSLEVPDSFYSSGKITAGEIQVYGAMNANYVGSFGSIACNGDLSVGGSKNSLQQTENYGKRLINAYETAEYYFGDIGSGTIGNDGECVISVDEILQECVNMNIPYHVFIQTYNGNITAIDRQTGYFIVYGETGTKFSWELKAKRKGYEHHRLEIFEGENPIEYSNIESELDLNTNLENELLEV
jgi:phage minor structural protein